MALRRNGDWTLHKVESGKYIVRESGTQRATIITSDFNKGIGMGLDLNTHEVRDFSEVEAKFEQMSKSSGPFF